MRKDNRAKKKGAGAEESGGTFWVQIPTLPLTEALSPHFSLYKMRIL